MASPARLFLERQPNALLSQTEKFGFEWNQVAKTARPGLLFRGPVVDLSANLPTSTRCASPSAAGIWPGLGALLDSSRAAGVTTSPMNSRSSLALALLTVSFTACASVTVEGEEETGPGTQLPSSGGATGEGSGGVVEGAGGGLIGEDTGGATAAGGSDTGGASTGGGAATGGATGSGGAAAGCDCTRTWTSATNITPELTAGDCMGYMGTLYEYTPDTPTATLQYADPACPPDASDGENCKWHAKMVEQGPCP